MKIAIPKERRAHESRVAASPETVKKLAALGCEVVVEKGAVDPAFALHDAPLLEDKPQRIMESESGVYGAKVAHQTHVALRRLGGVRPPREFVLMDRAAIGLGSVFIHLKAEINWYRLFNELIEGFDVDKLARRQATALKAANL